MIIDWILTAVQTLITTVFGILPNLPAMPQVIVDAGNWFVNTVTSMAHLFAYFYTPTFFNIVLVLLGLLLGFEQIYHLTMWIIKKVPVINVK